eukprot:COSAG01_NODE_27244_length_690_cov_2.318105_1_plen_50_part_10
MHAAAVASRQTAAAAVARGFVLGRSLLLPCPRWSQCTRQLTACVRGGAHP